MCALAKAVARAPDSTRALVEGRSGASCCSLTASPAKWCGAHAAAERRDLPPFRRRDRHGTEDPRSIDKAPPLRGKHRQARRVGRICHRAPSV